MSPGINKCSKHLVGKVVIVTGGDSGIGYETAKDLALRGARVILAGVDEKRSDTARNKIISESGNNDVYNWKLDLASFESIRSFAEEFIRKEKRLDILINNAGVIDVDNIKTKDGLNIGMQINYFGPFLLTNLLLPLIKSSVPSRIINVASSAYSQGKIDFQNLNMEKETSKSYSKMRMYMNSKLCCVLWTIELSRQLKDTGVTVNCVHPGAVHTGIVQSDGFFFNKILVPIGSKFVKTPWEGAQTSIYLAVSPEVENVSGCYFADCRAKPISEVGRNLELARKLWDESEKIVEKKS